MKRKSNVIDLNKRRIEKRGVSVEYKSDIPGLLLLVGFAAVGLLMASSINPKEG